MMLLDFSALPQWLDDVDVALATVPAVLDGATARGVLWQASRGRFLLEVPEVARYLVEEGKHIVVEPMPQADEGEVWRFLRLTPLAALLFQRGALALHAAAVAAPGDGGQGSVLPQKGRPLSPHAVIIAGSSGAGKSTLLAALLGRGWSLLADELVAVDLDGLGRPLVLPMFPEVRLWPDAMRKLGIASIEEERSLFARSPFPWSPCPPLAGAPLPPGALYWLDVHAGDDVLATPLAGAGRFDAVGALTYNTHVADALLDRGRYLAVAATIAQAVPMHRLLRPRRRWTIEELTDRITGE